MATKERNVEYGLPMPGHVEDGSSDGAAELGEGSFKYTVAGDNWGVLPEGWVYREATAVAVDQEDRVYVFNRGTCPMLVFDTDGNLIDSWGQGIFKSPHGVSVTPDGNLFCVDNGDSTVRLFTPGGELLMTLGEPNNPAPRMSSKPFSRPTHVAVDHATGNFYVSDGYANACVHKFSPAGELLLTWGESGTGEGQFNIVHNIATDSNGWVYVADRENHRIQVFSSDGLFEAQWVNMSRAACIYIDTRNGQDLVYIGEYFGGIGANDIGTQLGPRVTVMNTDGKILARIGTQSYGAQTGRFYSPHGIAVDSRGDIYVAEVSHSDYGSRWQVEHELRSMQKLVKI